MQRIIMTALMLTMGFGLVACGASAGKNGIAKRDVDGDIDYGKVAAVNHWAHRRGYDVHWINLPQKPSAERAVD